VIDFPVITSHEQAEAFLDARIGSGVKPGLERIAGLLELMGRPHDDVPAIHVAGTNGKTTTVRMIEDLLLAHDLSVGTFTSPHLERIEERFTVNGAMLDAQGLVDAVADVAPFVAAYEDSHATTITYFELTAAMAFQLFVSHALNAAVVEVGLGGRLDATNVLDADVSVITGIAIDHTSYLGDSIGEIAREKAGILKDGGLLVTGPLPAAAEGAVTARVAETGATWIRRGTHYDLAGAGPALGGWHLAVRGLHDSYEEIYLPLHGRHQVEHLATAIVAVEAFFGRALDVTAVREAAAAVESPGRIEVVGRNPLVILDGAHNEEGLGGLAATLTEEFPEAHRVLVVGFRGERNSVELLTPLRGLVGEVIATAAADPTAVPAQEVAAAAREVFGADVPVETVTPVAQAITEALHRVGEDDAVIVTGSLYVVGEARSRFA
jgi:dihydrofolate synthase/folylpolyglutamate synthase